MSVVFCISEGWTSEEENQVPQDIWKILAIVKWEKKRTFKLRQIIFLINY